MAGDADGLKKKITVGVCVMEKKVKCGSEVLFLFVFTTSLHKTVDRWLRRSGYIW